MERDHKFGVLRRILRALGLSQKSADDVVNFIVDLLVGERDRSNGQAEIYPYFLRNHFLSPAELNFYQVLKSVVGNRAVINCKVNLHDVIYVKSKDASIYRIYTNKIDRKHVDFVLCDPMTLQPLVAVELDDKSHHRQDRQERDVFVDKVFKTAGLPLIHIWVRRSYQIETLRDQIMPYIDKSENIDAVMPPPATVKKVVRPQCPQCGQDMVLRSAKRGVNIGQRFWGCPNYPTCKVMVKYQENL